MWFKTDEKKIFDQHMVFSFKEYNHIPTWINEITFPLTYGLGENGFPQNWN